ncbi:hypothetical protein OC834_006730, partial [Tilletia horrida]
MTILPILLPQLFTETAAELTDAIVCRHATVNWDEVDSCDQPSAWLTTTWTDWNALVDAGAFLFGKRGWPLRTRIEQASEPIKVALLLDNDSASYVAMHSLIKRGTALNSTRFNCGTFPYDLDVEKEWKRPVFFVHTSGSSIAVGPQGPAPSGAHIVTLLKKSGCDAASLVPYLIQEAARAEGGVDALRELKWLTYGGAGATEEIKIALDRAKVNYLSGYGLNECSAVASSQPSKWPAGRILDREWLIATPGLHDCAFEPFSEAADGLRALWELIVLPGAVPLSVSNRADGHATGDLIVRHPEYPEWFRIWGRKSEMVILLNGENAPVKPLEQAVMTHPSVQAALLFGHTRPQVGLLLKLRSESTISPEDEEANKRFRDELWPTIEKTNAELPNFAQLFKNMIIFTASEKALPRTDKGTVKRQLSLKLYDAEIDAVYGAAASGQGTTAKIRSISLDSLQDLIIEILHSLY